MFHAVLPDMSDLLMKLFYRYSPDDPLIEIKIKIKPILFAFSRSHKYKKLITLISEILDTKNNHQF